MRIVALLYALSWVAVRGMLVCGCPASKGGILRAISPAGRRFRASALVSGRKNHDVYAYMCTFFLVVAFHDARFLSGLYGRFSYIVQCSLHRRVLQHRRVGHCAYLSCRRRCSKGSAQRPSKSSSSLWDVEDCLQSVCVDDAKVHYRLLQRCSTLGVGGD